ncbi:hybrid sensor histidine kinase/response regulator [Hyphobacterium sp.]|uniref:hybrid sensor histidine kinase/response regulator n=1 Tax=Hyphobacterium sp. TaxID=2004662 RepID=UPI003BA9C997
MTATGRNSGDQSADLLRRDLEAVRLDQARLLLKRTPTSCLIVLAVILYFMVLILVAGEFRFAAIWLGLTSAMVGVVFLYPKFAAPRGITRANLHSYLRGHIIISGLTGLIWSGLAIAFVDASSTLHLFVSINIVASIALGGMMPSAEYRPSFISLSTAIFLPFTTFWLVTMDGPIRLIGIGLAILYGFGLLVSARSELQTRETLAAKRHRELSEKLQEQYRATERASAEKSRFLATTSHDMSQPLQAQGFFIRALRPLLNTPDQNNLLDKVETAWHSQQSLLRALVETARLESGAIIPKITTFDLDAVLESLRSEFEDTARAKSISLQIMTGAAPVRSDPLLVTRILRNLLSNAIRFTPVGGSVSLVWHDEIDCVLVSVTDNGPGVTDEEKGRIFEEYVQLENGDTGSESGLGLGLTIVRQLAAKLEIDLHFDSTAGKGTTASIQLPKSAAGPSQPGLPTRMSQIENTPLVVLIEDEPGIRESLSILLTSWGCRVIAADTGKGARELLSWSGDLPAAIIADKRLKDGEDGLNAALALREETLEDIPVILLTGDIRQFGNLSEIPKLSLVPKPADAEELYQVLVQSLDQASSP